MKKIFAIVLVITIVCLAAGCDTKKLTEANTPPALIERAREAEANVQKLRTDINDRAFWDSVDHVKEIIETSIEKDKEITILTKLDCSDGETINLESECNLNYINDEWRRLASNALAVSIATDESVAEKHASGETVEITGLIIKWKEYRMLGSEKYFISVCDLNVDGQWDYIAEGEMYFTDAPNTVLLNPENDNEPLGIGLASIRSNIGLVKVEKNETLSNLSELVLG